mgnify:FL=1
MECQIVKDRPGLVRVYRSLQQVDRASIDTEAYAPPPHSALDPLYALPAGVSLAWGSAGVYLPVRHSDFRGDRKLLQGFVRAIFQLPCTWWGWNWKYDLAVLQNFLGDPEFVPERFADGMLLAHKLDRGIPVRTEDKDHRLLGLKDMAAHHLGVKMATFEDTMKPYGQIQVEGMSDEDISAHSIKLMESKVAASKSKKLTKKIMADVRRETKPLRKAQVWRERMTSEIPTDGIAPYAIDDAVQTLRLVEFLCE